MVETLHWSAAGGVGFRKSELGSAYHGTTSPTHHDLCTLHISHYINRLRLYSSLCMVYSEVSSAKKKREEIAAETCISTLHSA